MILKISLRAKAGVPKTLLTRKFRLHSLYFPQNTLMLTESRGEFSDLHSIFTLRALRYWTTLFSSLFKSSVFSYHPLAVQEGICKVTVRNEAETAKSE